MTRLYLRPRALAGLKRAPPAVRVRTQTALDTLERGSLPPQTKQLTGIPKGYRIRIGQWRIVFILKNGEIDIADIFRRSGHADYQ